MITIKSRVQHTLDAEQIVEGKLFPPGVSTYDPSGVFVVDVANDEKNPRYIIVKFGDWIIYKNNIVSGVLTDEQFNTQFVQVGE